MPKPILVYDIETIPDYAAIARAHHLSEDDIEGAKRALGEDFPKPIFHSIVAIGMIWATYECDKSWRIREVSVPHIGQMSEKQLIETFVTTVAQTLPILVSYNGSAFDLPVIRHRALLNHVAGKALGAYPGYTGSLSSGDTENSRFDNSLKYQVHLGPTRFGAIYKFGGPGSGASPTNGQTYQLSAGIDYQALSFDAVYSHVSDAITLSSLTAAQVLVEPANSLSGTISDNSAVLLSAKYTWNEFKFFGGYEYIDYKDPKDPIAAPYVDGNGYTVSVATNTAYQYHDKILQLFWTGVKYAYNDHLVLSGGYYHELQNSYGKIGCNYAAPTKTVTSTSTCSGTEDAVGLVAEYHFNKRFEVYGGLMYTNVTNGIASGFLYTSSVDPTVGLRYTF